MEISVKEELHKMIDEADDVRLLEIYDLLNEGTEDTIVYTREEIELFYNRLADHEQGKGKSYSVEESFDLIRNNKF